MCTNPKDHNGAPYLFISFHLPMQQFAKILFLRVFVYKDIL